MIYSMPHRSRSEASLTTSAIGNTEVFRDQSTVRAPRRPSVSLPPEVIAGILRETGPVVRDRLTASHSKLAMFVANHRARAAIRTANQLQNFLLALPLDMNAHTSIDVAGILKDALKWGNVGEIKAMFTTIANHQDIDALAYSVSGLALAMPGMEPELQHSALDHLAAIEDPELRREALQTLQEGGALLEPTVQQRLHQLVEALPASIALPAEPHADQTALSAG